MKDERSDLVKTICIENVEHGCRTTCPLSEPCKLQHGDTKEVFDIRMNNFAEGLKL